MKAPFCPSRPPPPTGSADDLRENIAAQAALAASYAEHAASFADLGDDRALRHCIRCLTTYAVAAAEMLPQLAEAARQAEALKAAARSAAR